MEAERTFAAMGTTVHLIGVGDGADDLLAAAQERIDGLEARWSRFRPASELCRLNDRAGTPVRLTAETYDLIEAAVIGWVRTRGRFDPTVLGALEHAGYDRSFADLPSDRTETAPAAAAPVGCGGIHLEPDELVVQLPPGVRLDLGGIAKGYAADLVVDDLMAAGLDGACANLGGDVRVRGSAPNGGPWIVDIADPAGGAAPLARLQLRDGAVVTSTRLQRRWLVDGVEQHHLIDPRTGASAFAGWAQVSVIAPSAADAEVLAKAVYLMGTDARALLDESGAQAVLVADDGRVETIALEIAPAAAVA